MSRLGFTLIELLVVIAVIAVLAALLIPTIGYARTMARVSKAEAQIGTIKSSLNIFKDANGFYPDNGDGVFASVFKKGDEYKPAADIKSEWETVAEALLLQLQTIDRDNYRRLPGKDPLDALRDPFKSGGVKSNVYRYRPSKFYPLIDDAEVAIDNSDPPNPDSYQLWSAGPDGKDHFDPSMKNRKIDDIANWKLK